MNLYQKGLTDFREMYYSNAVLGIIASSCIGSIAAMLVLMSGTSFFEFVQLFLVVSVAMWYNASVLAQLKPKFVFNSLIVSVLMSFMLIVFHLIVLYL